MKYTNEQIKQMTEEYLAGKTAKEIASDLDAPERSIIAKLSSMGIYKRKTYKNKVGEVPVRKEEYINRIAKLLDINVDLLESMEKVTKTALVLIERQVTTIKKETSE